MKPSFWVSKAKVTVGIFSVLLGFTLGGPAGNAKVYFGAPSMSSNYGKTLDTKRGSIEVKLWCSGNIYSHIYATGKVTSNPAGMDGLVDGNTDGSDTVSGKFLAGTVVTVTVTAGSGSEIDYSADYAGWVKVDSKTATWTVTVVGGKKVSKKLSLFVP